MYNPDLIDGAKTGRAPAEAVERVLLGMPHLSGTGLSENWLLKHLGHVHWLRLAAAAGLAKPDFRDEAGRPVYAAFCALSIRNADFAVVRENEHLAIRSRLDRLSRTQVASQHELEVYGRRIGAVEMVSTFVRRDGTSNHTIARYAPPGLPPTAAGGVGAELADAAARHRSGRLAVHLGLSIDEPAGAGFRFSPCPSVDFNGAGFLYFASFAAFADRAEWLFARPEVQSSTIRRRDIFFTGNLDPGEDIVVTVAAAGPVADGMSGYQTTIVSETSGALLARVFTLRQPNA